MQYRDLASGNLQVLATEFCKVEVGVALDLFQELFPLSMHLFDLTLPVSCVSESFIEIKIKLNFIFTILSGVLKGFFHKKRSVKIKI